MTLHSRISIQLSNCSFLLRDSHNNNGNGVISVLEFQKWVQFHAHKQMESEKLVALMSFSFFCVFLWLTKEGSCKSGTMLNAEACLVILLFSVECMEFYILLQLQFPFLCPDT